MLIWLAAAIPGLTGLALLLHGWRGRRVDDHPLCRRCRYDLSGTPAIPERCPECGRDLRSRGDCRVGHRRKRPVPLAAGGLLVVVALGLGGLVAYDAARGVDWYTWKPLWLLRIDMHSVDPAKAIASQSEILSRLAADRLSESQMQSIVDEALSAQRNASETWFTMWGDFIEQGHVKGVVMKDDFATYLAQGLEHSVWLDLQPRARRGQPARAMVYITAQRMGTATQFATFTVTKRFQEVDGTDLAEYHTEDFASLRRTGRSGHGSSVTLDLPIGTHEVVLLAECSVGPLPPPRVRNEPNQPRAGDAHSRIEQRRQEQMERVEQMMETAWVTHTLQLPATIEVVPPDQPIICLTALSPEDGEMIRSSVTIEQCEIAASGRMRIPLVRFDIRQVELPAALGFDVYWRVDGHEWPIGAAWTHDFAGRSRLRFQPTVPMSPEDPNLTTFPRDTKRVDVIFRPNALLPFIEGHTEEIWNGEITLEKVPLVWTDS